MPWEIVTNDSEILAIVREFPAAVLAERGEHNHPQPPTGIAARDVAQPALIAATTKSRLENDELMIRWHDLPR
jgi:hypothetical protein